MFQLKDYLPEIRAIAEKNGCTKTAAVDRMVCNLDTFNEYNQGTRTLNYHVIGHQWGALTSAQKVKQKREAKRLISEPEAPATLSRKGRRR
ncbi:MAG: hypothetical protein NC489_18865 [Ruminococcus flavefaciens]|nr:hypothetical protein [Ruminococcus flavefaciens]